MMKQHLLIQVMHPQKLSTCSLFDDDPWNAVHKLLVTKHYQHEQLKVSRMAAVDMRSTSARIRDELFRNEGHK